jgi:hypothetical protein
MSQAQSGYYDLTLRLAPNDLETLNNLAASLGVPPAIALSWALTVATTVQDVQDTQGRQLLVQEPTGGLQTVSFPRPTSRMMKR